ncbi:MAG: S-layer homology domain-containing protein [Clostridia bacterium]|nr:S-layer homology domain-containing protein [Clostridia bacterium]
MLNKALSLFLVLLMLIAPITSALTVSADSGDFKIYAAYDLNNGYLSLSDLTNSIEEENGRYLHLTAKPGTYGNNDIMLSFSDKDLAIFDYPFVRIEYKTNASVKDILDTTLHHNGGENWPSSHPKMTSDGAWHSSVIDVNTIASPATVVADKTQKGITVRYKPWGGGNKAFEEENYFDIRFIGFFKTEAEAAAYKFDDSLNDASYKKYFGDTGFIDPNGEDVYAEVNAEIDAHIEKIKNTPTAVTVTGTKYYVAADGNDNNDGKTPETAWRSINKVKEFEFNKGDGVFFKRGDSFRADGVSLTLKSGVTYSAYGEGDKPVLVGSISAANALAWIETDTPNIYRYIDPVNDAGCIVFDGGRAWGVRMGPDGENSIDSGICHNGIDQPYQSGGGAWDSYRTLTNNLEFTNADGYVYLYSRDGNPAEVFDSIEILWNYHGVTGSNLENVMFDNIKLFGYGAHGISTHNVTNFTVQNCIFGWIGGSGHRYGNAVQNWENCDNFVIDMCYTYQTYDCAYTNQINADSGKGKTINIHGMKIINTVTEYSNTGLEVWNAGDAVSYKDCELSGNYVRNNGYGWSHQRPNKNGNFYYGAFWGNTPTWENYEVFNNKFAVAVKYGLLSQHISPENAFFHDNLYIMQRGKTFANTASNYIKGSGGATLFPYNDYTVQTMVDNGIEPGGKFYYLEEDFVPEAFDWENANDIYPYSSFTDVEGHWAEDYIGFAVTKELYNGVTDTEFAPDLNMTRAMFMTVLARYDGADLEDGEKWYDGAVKWAVTNAVTDANDTRPDDNITRAEMAVMIKKYIDARCIKYDKATPAFADASLLTGELGDAVGVCVSAGIISGYDDNTFKPDNLSTRAQVAAVFTRLDAYLLSAKPDINALEAAGRAYVYTADELENAIFVNTANATKELVDDNGVACLRFTPTVEKGTVQINLLQSRFDDGVDFYNQGVMRIKLKVTNGANKLDIGLRWTKEQWLSSNGPHRPTCPNGEWVDAVVAYENFTGNTAAPLPYESHPAYFYTFKPWGNNSQIPEGAHFEIEKIGFFTDLNTANNVEF